MTPLHFDPLSLCEGTDHHHVAQVDDVLHQKRLVTPLKAHTGQVVAHAFPTRIRIPGDLDPEATYRILFACSGVGGGEMGGLSRRHGDLTATA